MFAYGPDHLLFIINIIEKIKRSKSSLPKIILGDHFAILNFFDNVGYRSILIYTEKMIWSNMTTINTGFQDIKFLNWNNYSIETIERGKCVYNDELAHARH